MTETASPEKADPEQVAAAAAEAMYVHDVAAHANGIMIESIGPGRCVTVMTVKDSMLNGLGTCHGGYLFMLADTALGFASNSHGRHAFAQFCSITYLRPGQRGDRLAAISEPRARQGRTAMYDVTVVRRGDAGHEVLADFRGHTRDREGSGR